MSNIFKDSNELQLIRIVKDEDSQPKMIVDFAKYKLYITHENLIAKIARQFIGQGIDLEDLIQEGTTGFWIGVKKFNLDSGVKLATYAYLWIKNAIERKLEKYGFVIRTPYSVKKDIKALRKASSDFYAEYGYKPCVAELAKQMGWKTKKVLRTIEYAKGVSSLDEIVSREANKTTTFADMVKDEKENPHECVVREERDVALQNLYKKILGEREYKILAMQKGFEGREQMPIKAIAKEFGISVARVKQILKGAQDALRNSEELKEFFTSYKN